MRTCLLIVLFLLPALSHGSDLIRLGGSARSQAAANIVGLARDPISAITTNPALLSAAGNAQQVNVSTLYVDSVFTSSMGERATADQGPGIFPEFAFFRRSPNSNFSWGAGIVIQSALRADFEFLDPSGSLGVSYGHQTS